MRVTLLLEESCTNVFSFMRRRVGLNFALGIAVEQKHMAMYGNVWHYQEQKRMEEENRRRAEEFIRSIRCSLKRYEIENERKTHEV